MLRNILISLGEMQQYNIKYWIMNDDE